jgi:hypothetical protein
MTNKRKLDIEATVRLTVEEWLHSHGVGAAGFTVDQFCARNNVSRAHLYNLWKEGRRPRVMQACPGGKVTITPAAEADWHRQMEAATVQRTTAA